MDKPEIPPIYDRPGNLQRKMAMMARHIADIKNMLDYYGWVFSGDPWFAQRLQEAEAIYAELETAFKESIKGLTPADEDYDEKIKAAGQYIIQKHIGAMKELAKGPAGERGMETMARALTLQELRELIWQNDIGDCIGTHIWVELKEYTSVYAGIADIIDNVVVAMWCVGDETDWLREDTYGTEWRAYLEKPETSDRWNFVGTHLNGTEG